jgi:RecA-family ATPase
MSTFPREDYAYRQALRIKLVPFDQIKVGTERCYLIKGLIPRTGLTVVWGRPKSGKSFWTSDAVLHVALGWRYRGRRVHQGPVVYCCFEGATGFQARIEAFRKRQVPEDAKPVPFYLVPVTLNLVRDHAELIDTIHRELVCASEGSTEPVVIVLDTLNRSLEGSESSDEDMTAYVQACDAIREAFECAVIIVHHCGVDRTRPRGHTSLTGAADAQLVVKRPNQKGPFSVTVEYMKDGAEGDTVNCDLELV